MNLIEIVCKIGAIAVGFYVLVSIATGSIGIRCDRINVQPTGGHDDYCYISVAPSDASMDPLP